MLFPHLTTSSFFTHTYLLFVDPVVEYIQGLMGEIAIPAACVTHETLCTS